jgi:hypothetical protein
MTLLMKLAPQCLHVCSTLMKLLTLTLALNSTSKYMFDVSLDFVTQLTLYSVILFGKPALLPLHLELGL